MNVTELYEMLKDKQAAKGYYFNNDTPYVLELLQALLTNKERYGYMGCPCRLLSGNRDHDRDVICPCIYRTPDVVEFGSCYCQLYVSNDWNEGKIPHAYVPERRPPEKMF
jgi:ferredoxin-thioredoxin reductase catalytic chain